MKSQGPWVPGTTLWRAPHRTTEWPQDHIRRDISSTTEHTREQTDAMEHVTHGITLDGVARFVEIATDALSAAREEIDALNVYPVPDGDTGTNMFLTVSAARDALREALAGDPDLSLGDGMAVLARAALMGARGNSGVILSQMLRAYVHHLAGAAIADRPAETIAAAMAEATEAS
jgi:dihydroxyacetone kinase-like predicted kinase